MITFYKTNSFPGRHQARPVPVNQQLLLQPHLRGRVHPLQQRCFPQTDAAVRAHRHQLPQAAGTDGEVVHVVDQRQPPQPRHAAEHGPVIGRRFCWPLVRPPRKVPWIPIIFSYSAAGENRCVFSTQRDLFCFENVGKDKIVLIWFSIRVCPFTCIKKFNLTLTCFLSFQSVWLIMMAITNFLSIAHKILKN